MLKRGPVRGLAVDQAGVMLWMWDALGQATFFSPAWLEYRGRPLEDELGDGWIEGVHPQDRDALTDARAAAIRSQGDFRAEVRLLRFDGQHRLMLLQGSPRRNARAKFEGYVGWAAEAPRGRDGPDLVRLARLSTMGEIVAGLAHELNQPLAAISNFARAARHSIRGHETVDASAAEALDQIAEQADRAAEIIRHLRRFFRRAETQRLPVDVSRLVREAAVLLEVDARIHGAWLELDLDESLPMAAVERVEIEQVITNLVRNALEAMGQTPPDRRVVRLRTARAPNGWIEVSVEDAGCGISPELAPRLFEPFYTTKPGGMGLGLAISRSIVHAHGGRLEAVPLAKQGAVFRFCLPPSGHGGPP